MVTVLNACTVPNPSRYMGTSFCTTVPTPTGTTATPGPLPLPAIPPLAAAGGLRVTQKPIAPTTTKSATIQIQEFPAWLGPPCSDCSDCGSVLRTGISPCGRDTVWVPIWSILDIS